MQVVNEYGREIDETDLQWGDVYTIPPSPVVHKHFPLHAAQQKILASTARFVLALGGKNSGKSVIGGCHLLREVQKHPKGQFLVVAPTFGIISTATRLVWEMTVQGTPFQGKYHAGNTPWYECGTGAEILFRSAVDPDSFEGLKPLSAWIDEAGNLSRAAWKAVKGRVVGRGSPCILTTTPYPQHDWLVTDVIAKCEAGNPDYFYLCFPTTMNPTQDIAALEEERSTMSEWEYQVKYEGKFTKPKGLVYGDIDGCYCKTLTEWLAELDTAKAFYQAIDWGGGSDATAILTGMVDQHDNVWVFDEKYVNDRREDIVQTLDGVKDWNAAFTEKFGRSISRIWCDHRPENIRALKRLGLRAKPANKGANSIALGIGLVTARMRRTINNTGRGLYIIKDQCPALAKEATLYRYPTESDGEVYGATPIDKHNHAMDALRYLIMGLDRKAKSKRHV